MAPPGHGRPAPPSPRRSRPPWRTRRAGGTSSFGGASSASREQGRRPALAGKPHLGVDRFLSVAELEVQVRALQGTRLADGADRFTRADGVSESLLQLIEMRQQREHASAVIDDEEIAESPEPTRMRDLSIPDGAHRRARRRADVDARLQRHGAETWVDRAAEV